MRGIFHAQGRLTTRHPWLAVGLIVLLTAGFSTGFFLDGGPPQDQAAAFLPPGSDLALAQEKIAEDFAQQATTIPVQVIIRADAGSLLSPAGLQEIHDALAAASAAPAVEPFVIAQATTSVAHALLGMLQASSFEGISQSEVDDAFALLGGAMDGLLACGDDACTTGSAFATIGIIALDGDVHPDDQQALLEAQLGIEDVLDEMDTNVIEARSFSGAKLAQESSEAQGASTNVLMAGALGIILVLLAVFYRTGSDIALSLGGLVLTVMWVFGLQGLLGPGGIGLIAADSPLAMMIPILLIGLTVDYALQITGRYREGVAAGAPARDAMHHAVRDTGMPLLLAAGTTAVSFGTNVSSSLPPMQDFGIIAAAGVLLGWLVMSTLVPSVRTLIDTRRERRGRPVQSRHMSDAIPGISKAIAGLGRAITRRPSAFMAVAAVVSIAAFIGAGNVSTSFSETDFLPESTESYEDLVFLGEHFAGGDATATVLIEGDLEDPAVLRALVDLELGLADEASRPTGMNGPVRASLLTLAFDWAIDDGTPGDKYDEEVPALLAALDRFFPAASDLDALFTHLRLIDTAGFESVVALHGAGPDRTILTIPMQAGDPATTRAFVDGLEQMWEGDPAAFFVTGSEVLNVAVNDELTDSQTESVTVTIIAALILLVIFFGITERRPGLGIITVLPIVLVVGWVLGTMALLGISYNVMTALITALTIGVGVDYTIHMTHRFLEELNEGKGIRHAVHESLSTTGGALIGSALTTALGFAVLAFSPLGPMQQFGGLTALTILYSLIASFVVLPPMLVMWALFTRWRASDARGNVGADAVPVFGYGGSDLRRTTTVECPSCKTRTAIPAGTRGLRCPNMSCDYAGRIKSADRPAVKAQP